MRNKLKVGTSVLLLTLVLVLSGCGQNFNDSSDTGSESGNSAPPVQKFGEDFIQLSSEKPYRDSLLVITANQSKYPYNGKIEWFTNDAALNVKSDGDLSTVFLSTNKTSLKIYAKTSDGVILSVKTIPINERHNRRIVNIDSPDTPVYGDNFLINMPFKYDKYSISYSEEDNPSFNSEYMYSPMGKSITISLELNNLANMDRDIFIYDRQVYSKEAVYQQIVYSKSGIILSKYVSSFQGSIGIKTSEIANLYKGSDDVFINILPVDTDKPRVLPGINKNAVQLNKRFAQLNKVPTSIVADTIEKELNGYDEISVGLWKVDIKDINPSGFESICGVNQFNYNGAFDRVDIADNDPFYQDSSNKTPIIFVHGWQVLIDKLRSQKGDGVPIQSHPAQCTWYKMIHGLQQSLGTDKYDYYVFGYNSFKDIKTNAKELARVLNKFQKFSPIVIGHSMGGMVSKQAWMDKPGVFTKVITFATPHFGTSALRCSEIDSSNLCSKVGISSNTPFVGLADALQPIITQYQGTRDLAWKFPETESGTRTFCTTVGTNYTCSTAKFNTPWLGNPAVDSINEDDPLNLISYATYGNSAEGDILYHVSGALIKWGNSDVTDGIVPVRSACLSKNPENPDNDCSHSLIKNEPILINSNHSNIIQRQDSFDAAEKFIKTPYFEKSTVTVPEGEVAYVPIRNSDGYIVRYYPSDISLATIDKNTGLIHALRSTSGDGTIVNAASIIGATQEYHASIMYVKVVKKEQIGAIYPNKATIALNQSLQFDIESPATKSHLTWYSSKPDIVSVSMNGLAKVKAYSPDPVYVSATTANGIVYTAVINIANQNQPKTVQVSVNGLATITPPSGIDFNAVEVGTKNLSLQVAPHDGYRITNVTSTEGCPGAGLNMPDGSVTYTLLEVKAACIINVTTEKLIQTHKITLIDEPAEGGLTVPAEQGLNLGAVPENAQPVFLAGALPGYKAASVNAQGCTYEMVSSSAYGLSENDLAFKVTSLPQDCTVRVRYEAVEVVDPALQGTAEITVIDAATAAPVSSVVFKACTTTGNCTPVTTREQSPGVYVLALQEGTYTLQVSREGYLPASMQNVAIVRGQKTILERHLILDKTIVGEGTIRGRLLNAVSGAGVANVKLDIRQELYNATGAVVTTVTTDSEGRYSLNLPTGYYTATATREGYLPVVFNLYAIGGKVVDLGDRAMSPVLAATGDWRVVLTWGASPSDLDSHLTGPTANGNRFHVYFYNSSYQDTSTNVLLDRDDTSSYGPETTTIKSTTPGLLKYSVHDYSNRGYSGSALSNSGAKVELYRGSSAQALATFYVPAGNGDLWTVFTIDTTNPQAPKITPINTITTVGGSSSVQSVPNPNVEQQKSGFDLRSPLW